MARIEVLLVDGQGALKEFFSRIVIATCKVHGRKIERGRRKSCVVGGEAFLLDGQCAGQRFDRFVVLRRRIIDAAQIRQRRRNRWIVRSAQAFSDLQRSQIVRLGALVVASSVVEQREIVQHFRRSQLHVRCRVARGIGVCLFIND